MGRERVVLQEAAGVAAVLDVVVAESVPDAPAAVVELTERATEVPEKAPVDDMSDDDAELLDIFMEEAREVVQTGQTAIQALAADPANLADQTTLRRAFHTLKGSSRMVGLTEFGEAAWSFEQMLNASLAEQRPATDAMVALAASAMQAFARWVDDIANQCAHEWNAQDFRKSSDGLRLYGEIVPLRTPRVIESIQPSTPDAAVEVEALPVAVLPEPLEAEEIVSEITFTILPEEIESEPLEVRVDFASTQLADSLDFGVGEPEPEFTSTQLADSLDFDVEPHKPDFAATQMAVGIDFGEPPSKVDFVSTQMLDGPLDDPFAETAEPKLDFAATQTFQLDTSKTPLDPASPEFLGDNLGDFDFASTSESGESSPDTVVGDLAPVDDFPAPEAQSALEHLEFPEEQTLATDAVPHGEEDEEVAVTDQAEEQVKVIGQLRLSIPLYNVYLNEADEWSRRLQVELSEWALELHQQVPEAAVTLAHSLAGSSATVGFSALSDMARALEHALGHVQLHQQGSAESAQVFVNAAEDIRRLLHQFAAGFLKEPSNTILADLQAIIDTEFPAPELDVLAGEELDDLDLAEFTASGNVPKAVVEASMPVVEADAIPVAIASLFDVAPAPLSIVASQDEEIDAIDKLDADLFPIFEEEAAELLPQLSGALRQWVARPDNLSARSEVLRVLHTLKGSSRLAGALRLGEMSHRMESSIEHIGSDDLQAVQIEPLLTRFDALYEAFAKLESGEIPATPEKVEKAQATVEDTPAVVTSLAGAAEHVASGAVVQIRQTGGQSVRVRSQLLDRLVNQAGEVMITRSRMDARLTQFRASLAELGGNLDRLRQQLRDVEVQAESQMQSRLAQTKDASQSFDPLEFDRFTRLQELTRMMAESVNDVATVQRNLQRSVEGTEDDLIAQGRQARELQRDLLRTRMVEFEAISERLYGVVRQAGKDTGKQVKLDIVGGSIDMDRGVLERMAPAFEHVLRNSVAHGIESPAERAAAGKPPVGSITIRVSQVSNDVYVAFSDDGAGLPLEKIRAKAIAKGVIAADTTLSAEEAADLIFMPGFTTAEKVTEVSGRGIGMDVVRSEVNSLGGRIETATESGKGTSFKLVLPLTTAVTQVVMLRMGEFTIGVPSNLMETVLRAPAKVLEAAYLADGFDMAGQTIPFFWAGALLQVSARSNEAQTKTLPVAVFRSAGQRLALHVDEVLGNREVVVKNLGPQLGRLPGLAGVSVLASGAVVLIYNPVALASVYGEQARKLRQSVIESLPDSVVPGAAVDGSSSVLGTSNQVPLVLVVDDSITVRRVTQRLLKREGYRIALAADGLQALEKLQEEKPAVVLSDIEMPRMDGFDLARNIRGDARLRDLPIIMITSRIAEKHREHAKELGVDHYLGKPYSEDELLGLVRSYCHVASEA
jgi:chemosensory pili system protein ChpA (sensor histidine kinase/response regulator)